MALGLMSRSSVDPTQSPESPPANPDNMTGAENVGSGQGVAAEQRIWISSAQFTLFDDTQRQYAGPYADHTLQQVREEAFRLLTSLRRKANGILLNFTSARELDWTKPAFDFPNGEISERLEEIAGPFEGTIRLRAIIEVDVINPNEETLAKLVASHLRALDVLRIGYHFSFAEPDAALPSHALTRLQSTYPILSWDPDSGAEVALPHGLRLMVRTTPEEIGIALATRYPFQLEQRVKEFSVREFVEWLRT